MKFDTLVIGAGSAGAVVAARVSENPERQVALVEAGPDYPDFALLPAPLKFGNASAADITTDTHQWGFSARATPAQDLAPLPRGRVTGGTSAINGQIFARGLPEDFDRWAELGNLGWSFADVSPVYRRLETDLDFDDEHHGGSGPVQVHRYPRETWLPPQVAFYEACLNAGYAEGPDMNAPLSTGVGPVPFNNVGGIRASSALTHLDPVRSRENLHVIPETVVRRLQITGVRVTGVQVVGASGVEVIEADEVVLAAGSIGSPHLLLLSGVGPADELRAAGIEPVVGLRGVGSNLRDHQVVDLWWERADDVAIPPDSPVVQIALRLTATGSSDRNNLKVTIRNRLTIPGIDSRLASSTISIVPGLELAESRGTLKITSADHRQQPRVDLNFLESERDRAELREAVLRSLELANDGAFSKLIGERLSPKAEEIRTPSSLDTWLTGNVRTSHHLCGTCKMGAADDGEAVVDQECRVYGIENLRVADASICPNVVRANLNATAMMIGERVADFMTR